VSQESTPARSSGDAAYAAILSALREGTYAPGDRLRETDLGARLGLSRTPVREAMRKLESDGIVEHRPRIGAVIRVLSHSEMVELYEMRIILERTAAELAARHGSPAEFDTLEHLNTRVEAERGTPALSAAINQDFHRTLYLAGRNRFLAAAARALNNSLLLLGPTTYTDPDRIDVVLREHGKIIAALRAGDAAAAGDAAEAHLQTSLRYRLRYAAP
jgi:DNA-binding GntR family transcriptional regulator